MVEEGWGWVASPNKAWERQEVGCDITAARILTRVLEMASFALKIVHTTPIYPHKLVLGSICLTLHQSYGVPTHVRGRVYYFGSVFILISLFLVLWLGFY